MSQNIHKTLLHLFASWVTISLVSCSTQEAPAPENISVKEEVIPNPQDTVESVYSYLALGDSYTIGQGILADQNWPNQLIRELEGIGQVNNGANIIAQTGWTTADLLDAINEQKPVKHDLVSLQIGVNNQFQNTSFSQFKDEFDNLLTIAIGLSNDKKIMVVSIPDYSVTPFVSVDTDQIAEEIDKYNNFIQQACDELEVEFVNVTTISRNLGASSGALTTDRLHPSATQYGSWIEEILPIALGLLSK